MDIQITNIKKKDYKKAIQFAKTGMHFDLYLETNFYCIYTEIIFGMMDSTVLLR